MSAADVGTGGLGGAVSAWWSFGRSLRSPSSFADPVQRRALAEHLVGRMNISGRFPGARGAEPPIVAPTPAPPVFGQPTPPYQSAVLREAQRVLAEARKSPKKTRKRLRKAARREQWEKWIRLGRVALPKGGKVAKAAVILRRLPKVAGYGVGPSIAFEVGYRIGTEIYKRGTAWYYGPDRPAAPPKAPREHPHPAATPPQRPQAPRPAPPTYQGRPGEPRRTVAAPRQAQAPTVSLEPIRVTVPRMPTPAPAPAPAPSSSSPTARATSSRTAQLQKALGIAASVYGLMPRKGRRRQAAPLGVPGITPEVLTQFQTQALPYRQAIPPTTKTKTCTCEKPRKRSGKPRCTNPVVRRRKQTRDGRTLVTTTREMKCPQSSRKKLP